MSACEESKREQADIMSRFPCYWLMVYRPPCVPTFYIPRLCFLCRSPHFSSFSLYAVCTFSLFMFPSASPLNRFLLAPLQEGLILAVFDFVLVLFLSNNNFESACSCFYLFWPPRKVPPFFEGPFLVMSTLRLLFFPSKHGMCLFCNQGFLSWL